MEAFTRLRARAWPLGLANIDTDQLIPARFMKRSRGEGYGGFLLHDLRFDENGTPRPGFPLGAPGMDEAKILIARRNFGTGSSREAAVYALWDFGIRCVIAPSFGDIFASNAVKNGLLPAIVGEAEVERLLEALAKAPGDLEVDLDAEIIRGAGLEIGFSVDPVRRLQLLNGWDDIDLTLRHRTEIDAFRAARALSHPWLDPSPR